MIIIHILYCLIVIGFLLTCFISLYYEKKANVPPVPIMPHVKKQAIKLLHDHIRDHDIPQPKYIIDLGSGWGGPMLSLSKGFPQAQIIGYELSPIAYAISWLRLLRRRNTSLFFTDFFDDKNHPINWEKMDVIFCYLSPHHMEKLAPIFDEKCQPGTIIISCAFPIKNRTPITTKTVKNPAATTIHLY